MNFLMQRIKEPSTWAALSAIAALLGAPVGSVDAIHSIVGGVAGLVAIFLPEANHEQ